MAEFGLAKKGCVNLSLRDSGTKGKKLLRVLSLLTLIAMLFVMSSVMVAAQTDDNAVAAESTEGTVQNAVSESTSAKGTFSKSGYSNLNENASIGERFMYGLRVTGIGMVVVFLVLIIIMAILYVFKLVALAGTKKEVSASQAAPAAPVASASTGNADEETVVAVATAAIAASRGASSCAFKVISITKIQ